jgi:transposase
MDVCLGGDAAAGCSVRFRAWVLALLQGAPARCHGNPRFGAVVLVPLQGAAAGCRWQMFSACFGAWALVTKNMTPTSRN